MLLHEVSRLFTAQYQYNNEYINCLEVSKRDPAGAVPGGQCLYDPQDMEIYLMMTSSYHIALLRRTIVYLQSRGNTYIHVVKDSAGRVDSGYE